MGGAASTTTALKDYVVGQRNVAKDGPSLGGWELYIARHNSDASNVLSVFRASKATVGAEAFALLQRGVARLRATRHPNVLKFVDASETAEALVLVTEAAVPLRVWLSEGARAFDAELGGSGESSGGSSAQQGLSAAEGGAVWSNAGWVAWGVESLVSAVKFVGEDKGGCHGCLCAGSVLVTPAGAWRLGMLEFQVGAPGSAEGDEGRRLWGGGSGRDGGGRMGGAWVSPERREAGARCLDRSPPWAQDSWGLGCVLAAVSDAGDGEGGLDGVGEEWLREWVRRASEPQRRGGLGGSAGSAVTTLASRLLSTDASRRPSPSQALSALQPWLGSLAAVRTLRFLEELPVREPGEKRAFFDSLPAQLGSVALVTRHGHVLPLLMHAIEFGAAGGGGTAALAPILGIGASLPRARFEAQVLPCVVRLFASRDRATRMQLLHHMESFVGSLSARDLHEQIWQRIREGFADAEVPLRMATVKAVVTLTPHLLPSDRLLAVRHVAAVLARDPVPGMRVNAAICLARITPLLTPASERARLVDPLVASATQDDFPPVRRACFQALGKLFTMGLRPFVPPPEPTAATAEPATAASGVGSAASTASTASGVGAATSAASAWVANVGMDLLTTTTSLTTTSSTTTSSTTASSSSEETWGLEAGRATVAIIAACGQGALDSDPQVRSIALSVLLAAHTSMCTWSAQKATYDEAKALKQQHQQQAAASRKAPSSTTTTTTTTTTATTHTSTASAPSSSSVTSTLPPSLPPARAARTGISLSAQHAPVADTSEGAGGGGGWDDGDGWGDFDASAVDGGAVSGSMLDVRGAMSDAPAATPKPLDGWGEDDLFSSSTTRHPPTTTTTFPSSVPSSAPSTAPTSIPSASAAASGAAGASGAAAARARMEERKRARQAERAATSAPAAAAPTSPTSAAAHGKQEGSGEGWGFDENW